MRIIKTLEDIRFLKEAATLDENYLNHIETFFHQLMDSLRNDESEENFTLEAHGYIVILEKGDNVRDLSVVGLNSEDGGLLGSCPEFVERLNMKSLFVYQIGVLYNNDYMMTFFSEIGIHDQEVETWLEEEI